MKVLFAGPTLHGLATAGQRLAGSGILCRPPAQQGDLARAVLDGATVIGLVDGRYEDVAAPWHKEILYALDQGVTVFGGASMGALRAAECAPFGMIPVGIVAQLYIDGVITEDAAVAQIHAPPELGSAPLSEALVNVDATLQAARAAGALPAAEASRLAASARRIFFKDRTLPWVVEQAGVEGGRREAVLQVLRAHWRDIKREDALALIATMGQVPAARNRRARDWTFREPSAWRRFLSGLPRASPGPD